MEGGATRGVEPPHRGSGVVPPVGVQGSEPLLGVSGGEAPQKLKPKNTLEASRESALVM